MVCRERDSLMCECVGSECVGRECVGRECVGLMLTARMSPGGPARSFDGTKSDAEQSNHAQENEPHCRESSYLRRVNKARKCSVIL